MEKIKIDALVVVEGKYDKIRLSSFLDAHILATDGFRIFKNPERLALIRRLGCEKGVLVLTDSDGAGLVIRRYLQGAVPPEKIKHAYIPAILGKEKRKQKPSKEGTLGVEGMTNEILFKALSRAGAFDRRVEENRKKVTKADFFEDGLTGAPGSAERRAALQKKLDLPGYLTPNGLLQAINSFLEYDEYKKAVAELDDGR